MATPSSNRFGTSMTNHVDRRIPRNSAALSRSIEIVVNGIAVGYIKKFTMNEGRKITDVREIGNEDLVELAPGGPENLTLDVERTMLYASRLQTIFDDESGNHGNKITGIQSLMDFNYPFNVFVLMRTLPVDSPQISPSAGEIDSEVKVTQFTTGGKASDFESTESNPAFGSVIIMDHFHECYFEKVSYTINAEADFVIAETGTIRYTWRTGSPMTRRLDIAR